MDAYQAAKLRHLHEFAARSGLAVEDDGERFIVFRIVGKRRIKLGSRKMLDEALRFVQHVAGSKTA